MPTPCLAIPGQRLHALDAVRGFALVLGVALHASLSYLPGAKSWWIIADDPSLSLAGLFFWVHLFRMTLFFLVAGFFGRLLLERLGLRAFVRDRARRITGVLLAGWTPIFMAILVALLLAVTVANGGVAPPTPPQPAMTVWNFPLTHLWFLYVLTIFYAVALVVRAAWARLDARCVGSARVDRLVSRLFGVGGVLALALPGAVALAGIGRWPMWFGVPTPDTGLLPNLAAMVSFGVAFGAGWLLQRQPLLLAKIADLRWSNIGLALAATIGCLSMVGITPVLSPATEGATKLAYAACYAVAGWAWALALLGLALRHCNGYSPLRRYLSDASYWIYLVHLPMVMALQAWTYRLGLPWWCEYPMLLAIVLAISLASYELVVRHGWIGAWLNGKRVPRATPAARAAHVAG